MRIITMFLVGIFMFLEAFAACSDNDVWKIFPVETEVGDVSFATRMDSGPVKNGDVVVYSRSWRGGAGGVYRNVTVRLYVYPDAESARKRVEEYGRSLGSRAKKLGVGDLGYSPAQRYTFRSYYLVAKDCSVIELFSSYANAGLVGDDTNVLRKMVSRISSSSCLCGEECRGEIKLSPQRASVGQRVVATLTTDVRNIISIKWSVWDGIGRKVPFTGSGKQIEYIQPPSCVTVLAAVKSPTCYTEIVSSGSVDLGRADRPPKIKIRNVSYNPSLKLVKGAFEVSDPDGDPYVVRSVELYSGPINKLSIYDFSWVLDLPSLGKKGGVYYFSMKLSPEFLNEMRKNFKKSGSNKITLLLDVLSSTCKSSTKEVYIPVKGSPSVSNPPNLPPNPPNPPLPPPKGNRPPSLKVQCITPFNQRYVGRRICFKALVRDPDGDPVAVRWFVNGAGMGSIGREVCRVFKRPGVYTITAAVSDGLAQGTANYVLEVSTAPKPKKKPEDELEYGVDRPGMDYTHFTLPKPDPSLCRAKCYEQVRCKAWTYVKPNTVQGPFPVCWLKSGVPKPVPNPNTVSGVVKRKASSQKEPWLRNWKVVANCVGKIPNSNKSFGWKSRVVDIGDALPPPGAHGGALYMHPLSRSKPARIRGSLYVKSPFHKLVMRVAGNRNGDWLLEVRVNGRRALTKVIDGRGWHNVVVPMGAYRGKWANVEILVWANGWSFEYAFIDEILDTY